MIDKEEQRRRAAQLDAERRAQGLKAPTLPPIPAPKQVAGSSGWPFATPDPAPIKNVIIEPSDPRHPQHALWKSRQPAYKTQPITAVQHAIKQKKVKAPKKPKYLQEDFTNEIGQVIRPGQRIVAVSQGYNHSIGVAQGTYLGLRKNSNGSVRSVTVQLSITATGYQVNGKKVGSNVSGASWGKYSDIRTVTLPRKRIYAIV